MGLDKDKVKSMKWYEILDVDMKRLPPKEDDFYMTSFFYSKTKEERWMEHYRGVEWQYETLKKKYSNDKEISKELFRAFAEYTEFNRKYKGIQWTPLKDCRFLDG